MSEEGREKRVVKLRRDAVVINLLLGNRFSPILLVGTIFLYLVASLIGLWRGHRARWFRYVQYLLQSLPKNKHAAAVEGIYEEVYRHSIGHTIGKEIDPFDKEIESAT